MTKPAERDNRTRSQTRILQTLTDESVADATYIEPITPEFVAKAHENDMEVNPFYADDEAEMRRLIDCGVDGILTNFPRRLQQVLLEGEAKENDRP